MKLLFVCSQNKLRSPTAEKYFKSLGYETRSAGTSQKAIHPIDSKDIKWADTIFVMEPKHEHQLKAYFSNAIKYKKVIVLNIPDDFKKHDPKLIELLKKHPLLEEKVLVC